MDNKTTNHLLVHSLEFVLRPEGKKEIEKVVGVSFDRFLPFEFTDYSSKFIQ